MLATPRCFERQCRHFIGVSQPDGTELTERVVCAAFLNGIPNEIAYGDNLHLQPFPGDHGIQYDRSKSPATFFPIHRRERTASRQLSGSFNSLPVAGSTNVNKDITECRSR